MSDNTVPQGVTFGAPDTGAPAPTGATAPTPPTVPEGVTFGTAPATPPTPKNVVAPGDIDYSSYGSATKGAVSHLGTDLYNSTIGAAKGLWDTVATPPQDETEKSIHGVAGYGGLGIYRVLRSMGKSAKEATDIAGIVHDINNSPDPMGSYAKALQSMASEGAGQTLTALATEGVLKGVPKAGEFAKPAYRAVEGKFSPKYLQEPLQGDLKGVLDQTAQDSGVGGPPPDMNYAHDQSGASNMQHKVTTTDASGKKVGELAAQDTAPDTVNVRSNQVYDTANRGRGYGKAQIQKLLEETKNSGKKFVQSDISTTEDAQRVWRKLEEEHPDAITHKEFKPKAAEGQPEPLGSKHQWTVDLDKYNPPPAEALKPVAPKGSIRDAAGDMGDKVLAESKADYEALDEATNGRFQRFRDRLEANRRKLNNLTDSEEDRNTEASILKNQKETEDAMSDAFEEAKAKGVDPNLIDRADANFKKSQALYDLDTAVKRSTTGARPGVSHPDLLAEHPETINPKMFHKRINAMYDSGRLQDALGEEQANRLFDSTLEHSGAYDKIMRNQKIAKYASLPVATALGGGYAAHRLGLIALGGEK